MNTTKYKDRRRRIIKKCEICGISFSARVYRIREPNRIQKVCSPKCRYKLRSNQHLAKGHKIKMGVGGGYIGIYMPKHHRVNKDGYVLEHILVWEKAYNIHLPDGWIIHHLNGIKNDNRLENLEALPRRKHNSNRMFQELQLLVEQQGVKIQFLEKQNRLQAYQIKMLNKNINDISQIKMKEQ